MSEIDELAEKYLEAKLKAKDREYEQGIHQARVSFIGSLISFLVFFALAVFSYSFYWEVNGVEIHDYVGYYFPFLLFLSVCLGAMSVAYFLRIRRLKKERRDLAAPPDPKA